MKIYKAKSKVKEFKVHLQDEQKSNSTIKQYSRVAAIFFVFAELNSINTIKNDVLLKFKLYLIDSFSIASVNAYIVDFNAFLSFLNYNGIRIKCIKRQGRNYIDMPINDDEYNIITEQARLLGGDTCAIIKTLAGTGIRVGELKYITVEAVKQGIVEINNKGKTRRLNLSESICIYLLGYCNDNNISSGIIFRGKDGVSPITTSAIWRKINSLSKETGIDKGKMHPHNFRHFYSQRFMKIVNDISVLKDLLGHSDIKTTTIYLHPDGDYIRQCVNKIAS